MKNFLSCDWGTSSFRLKFVEVPSYVLTSTENPDQGIAKIFELWKKNGNKEEERFSFYLEIIKKNISLLEDHLKFSLKNTPLIISGMASSSMGMAELPYKEIPFFTDGSDLVVSLFKATVDFAHDIILISGAKTDSDVMRGEETQLVGCSSQNIEEGLFIFPGTHSKHIWVKSNRVVRIRTYMTGEFFDLLSQKSILSGSVLQGEGLSVKVNMDSFKKGVEDSTHTNLLHAGFQVRTNDLFKKLSKQENYYYLSGLLIGTELRELENERQKNINLVTNDAMKPYYITAVQKLYKPEKSSLFKTEDADRALINGQYKIWSRLEK